MVVNMTPCTVRILANTVALDLTRDKRANTHILTRTDILTHISISANVRSQSLTYYYNPSHS